jgi:hypothetical protein
LVRICFGLPHELKTALFGTAAPNFLGDSAAIPSKIRRSNAKIIHFYLQQAISKHTLIKINRFKNADCNGL